MNYLVHGLILWEEKIGQAHIWHHGMAEKGTQGTVGCPWGVTGTCSQNLDKIILRANLDRFKISLICAKSLHEMFTATLQAHG